MSGLSVTYSHAAPQIRARLAQACRSAADSRTLRSRREHIGQAYGFAAALRIMAASEDQTPADGIANNPETFDKRDLGYVARFLGSPHDFETIMGGPVVDPFPWPWDAS